MIYTYLDRLYANLSDNDLSDGEFQQKQADIHRHKSKLKNYEMPPENHPETPDYESHKGSKAVRSGTKPRYDLITPEFLKSLGETLDHGEKFYGAYNWQKADERFANDAINHLLEHVYKFNSGDRSEDHLGHAAANLMFIQWYNSRNPEWFSGK